ncbi:MAG: polyphosphate kinase 2 family protein [Acidimicrobiales bacterium]|nr:polyphosphate kinase 2 family protein [Acidimicrobiales bacterium]
MAAHPADLHRIEPGAEVDLGAHDPADTSAAPGDKAATREALDELTHRLADLQARLWAEAERRVLVVLQGMDTSGKGGTVKHVFGAVNPAGLRVVSFKAPSASELERDYLWRVHANVPAAGEIGVFDRSHYEDVLAVRVQRLVSEERWRRRYEHIKAFEHLLADEGTAVVKVLLHLSADEQKARLQARLDDPTKHWKFRLGDLDSRERWDEYQIAFAETVERTTAHQAPWHIVPANKKWYRNWAVASILVGVLERMDPQWPEPPDEIDGISVT